ncbi:MAG: putative quinol monooxygenase [Sphingomonadaceae bacterium]
MTSSTDLLVVRMTAKYDRRAELKTMLTSMVPDVRREEGCLLFELFEDQAYPGRFVMLERWESEALRQVHLASPPVQAFIAAGPTLLAQPLDKQLLKAIT